MESPEEQVIYRIDTRISNLVEEFGSSYMGGFGKDAIFHKYSKGWYAHFQGSWEKLFLGMNEPTLKAGDEITILIKRKDNALPSEPPVQ